MVKTATLSEHQTAQRGDAETSEPTVAEQLQALSVQSQCDASMSISQIKGMVLKAADDDVLIAHHDEISVEAERIWASFGYQRSHQADLDRKLHGDTTIATVTVNGRSAELGSDEAVELIETAIIEAHAELPGMPPRKSVLRVPSDAEFGDDDYFISTALSARALVLIDRHPEHLDHLDGLSVTYLWKKAGGKSKRRPTVGKTTKASGLLKLFSEATFCIWLAADHSRGMAFTEEQIEAALFHQMLYTGVAEEDEETGRGGGPTLMPVDLEMFRAEVEVYGLWSYDLKAAAPVFTQGRLFERAKTVNGVSRAAHDGTGTVIHDDGTPYTADEIAALEQADLRDDPAEDASGLDCKNCGSSVGMMERPHGVCAACMQDGAEQAYRDEHAGDGLPDDADHDL